MRNPAMNAGAGDVEMPEVDGKDPRSGDRFEQLGKEEGLASIDSLQEGDDLGVRHEKLQSPSHFLQVFPKHATHLLNVPCHGGWVARAVP